jgi:formylglycine-generating enzyme required for sulfatase activity/DNA-binding NarL/FixJ family response regulator
MRILIVDDEAGVLQALMAIMRALPGHEVKVAANAQKAHEHAAGMGGVDLLITDVVMEPVDGFSLRAELQAKYPAMQTVFISGYDLSDYAEHIAGAPALTKPVDAMELISEIGNAAARLAAPVAKAVPEKARLSGKTTAIAVPAAASHATPQPVPQPVAQPVAVAQATAVPAAQPVAVPQAVAQPVAVPQATAVPAAQPASVPQAAAQPVARAVPQATAVPAAQPAAVPQATAQPVARAVPQATAVPTAQPVAVPQAVARAVPQATAVPAAQPVAVPQAAAQPVARAVPQPSAVPVAQPVAAPRAVAPAAATPVAAAAPAGGVHDPLIGVQLGDYRVQQLLGEGKWGRVYLALQLSVNRRVGLKVLNPASADDEGMRTRFMNDARAKAAVQHPSIMTVFEADERNGLFFFTQEYVEGASLAERISAGQFLEEKTALHVLKIAGEALQYLWSRNLSHSAIEAGNLRLGTDNIARMANIATAELDSAVTVESELQTVGSIIRQLTQDDKISVGLRMLLTRMTGGPNPVTGWPMVLQAVKALEPKVIPVEAAKMKAADAAAMRAVEAARKAKKRSLIINMSTLAALLGVLGYVVWKYAVSNMRKLDVQVQIPAGTYPVGSPGDGIKATLGAFEIDKYEVSIGEYAKFIAWCEKNPDKEHEFDHPKGDRKTPHVNNEVKTLILNAAQRGRRVFKQGDDPGAEIDLNSPMVAVTFWDAYAYAQWRGKIVEAGAPRDLPTEEEWEAAARGPRGFKYPWGDELKPGNFNSNQGYKPLAPGSTKTDDGFNYWAPVDKFTSDVSEFKVVGMAGNVSEWVYRKEKINEIPLLKGGSFASDPIPMWGRVDTIPAEDAWFVRPASEKKPGRFGGDSEAYFVGDTVTKTFRSLYVGFRTVKRK